MEKQNSLSFLAITRTAFVFTLELLAIPFVLSVLDPSLEWTWTRKELLFVVNWLFAGLWGTLLLVSYIPQKSVRLILWLSVVGMCWVVWNQLGAGLFTTPMDPLAWVVLLLVIGMPTIMLYRGPAVVVFEVMAVAGGYMFYTTIIKNMLLEMESGTVAWEKYALPIVFFLFWFFGLAVISLIAIFTKPVQDDW